jgi:RimJ/RimL family protein N-acetyltransferase
VVGVLRLEARAVAGNGRGNGALGKIGAVAEGRLRRSFLHKGEYLDQILWTVLDEDWRQGKNPRTGHAVFV